MMRRSGRTRGKRCPGIIGGPLKGSHGVRIRIAGFGYRALLAGGGGTVMGTQLMSKRTRDIVIKQDFHGKSLSNERGYSQ
jgi:hypothetical protein